MADQQYFEFRLGRDTEHVQYLVRVYRPAPTNPIPGLRPQDKAPRPAFMELLNRIQTKHITMKPDPTATLVSNGKNRINTQHTTTKWRNVRFEAGSVLLSEVTVDDGAELCLTAGLYEVRLLRFIKEGLILSLEGRTTYNIAITVQSRVLSEPTWMDLVDGDFTAIRLAFEQKIQKKIEESVARRIKSAKNLSKIVGGSDMIEHVAAAIERRVGKIAETEGGWARAKKSALVSRILGVVSAVQRGWYEDYNVAIAKLVSGVTADLPRPETAVSLGIDAGLLASDIQDAVDDDHKKIVAAEKEGLRLENAIIREELKAVLPESPIYGSGCEGAFDECELANLEDIRQISVRAGDLIHAIKVVYQSQSGRQHGGGGGTMRTLNLSTEEKITTVSGTTVHHGAAISSLTFCTDSGQEETFGIKDGEEFQFEMTGGAYLGAIKGYDAYVGGVKRYLDIDALLPAIGFIPKC